MKRADDTLTALGKIKDLYSIKNDCTTVEQILQNLHVAEKETEYLCINLMIDKYKHNKNFRIDRASFLSCRQEVKDFLE